MIFLFCKIVLILIISFITTGLLPQKASALAPSAASAILIETSSNTVLYEKNAHKKLPMASTTKIVTALCAIESGRLDKIVQVDDSAVGVEGSSIYLQKGEKISLEALVYGLMLHSGNDAAVAIACAVSGSVEEFTNLMNETAKKAGATHTNFENPNGLDSKNHYTTAYDLAIITSYALKNEKFAKIVSTYKTTISNGEKDYARQLKNHNKLLTMYEGCTGVKTGFTKKCGRCLVSSAKRDNTELVAVTLNDGNDWADHMRMLDYGFDNTETICILKKGDYISKVQIKGGSEESVDAICNKDVYITVPKGKKIDYTIEYDMPERHTAPVDYGQKMGSVSVVFSDKSVIEAEVVAGRMVGKKPKSEVFTVFSVLTNIWVGILN